MILEVRSSAMSFVKRILQSPCNPLISRQPYKTYLV